MKVSRTHHVTKKGTVKKNPTYDVTGNIIAYESGELNDEQTIDLFQHLVDNGMAWQLQGSYGRTANDLLEAGLIHPPKNRSGKDYYGNDMKPYYDKFDKGGEM